MVRAMICSISPMTLRHSTLLTMPKMATVLALRLGVPLDMRTPVTSSQIAKPRVNPQNAPTQIQIRLPI